MLVHVITGKSYKNRLEAKLEMGSANFNKAHKNGEIQYLNDEVEESE